jgi:hypothetical protein
LAFIALSFSNPKMGTIKHKEQAMSIKTNLALDISIFAAFLVANNPSLTGTTIHEWFNLAFAAAIVTHLLFHWDWIAAITKKFIQNLFHASRLNYVVDALFFAAMTATMFSGLLISRSVLQAFGLSLPAGPAWRSIHNLSANVSLLLLGVHSALHWNWIVTTLARYIVAPVRALFNRPVPDPAVQPVQIDEVE